jgi:hypothetical protein
VEAKQVTVCIHTPYIKFSCVARHLQHALDNKLESRISCTANFSTQQHQSSSNKIFRATKWAKNNLLGVSVQRVEMARRNKKHPPAYNHRNNARITDDVCFNVTDLKYKFAVTATKYRKLCYGLYTDVSRADLENLFLQQYSILKCLADLMVWLTVNARIHCLPC